MKIICWPKGSIQENSIIGRLLWYEYILSKYKKKIKHVLVTQREVQNQTQKQNIKQRFFSELKFYFKNKCVCASTWPKTIIRKSYIVKKKYFQWKSSLKKGSNTHGESISNLQRKLS